MEQKGALQSLTVQAVLLMGLKMVLDHFGIAVSDLSGILDQIINAGLGIMAIYGRVRANTTIKGVA